MTATSRSSTLSATGCGPVMQSGMLAEDEPCAVNCTHLHRSPVFLLALIAVTGLGPFAMSSFIPALPAIQADFGVSASVSQLTISAAMVSMAIGSLFYGNLADRFGRRPVLLIGVMLAVLGSVVCAVAPTIWIVIAGRCLQAAGGTVGFVLARVVVKDVYGEQRAASVLGYVTAAMALAPLIGPLLGGYLVEWAGWRAVFTVVAVGATVLWVVLAMKLPETKPNHVRGERNLVPWPLFGALLQRTPFLRMLIFGAALQGAFMAFVASAPFVVTGYFNLPVSAYGWYFSIIPVGFFLGSLVAGRYSKMLGNGRLVWWGAVGAVVSCAVAFAVAGWGLFGAWGLFVPAALLAVAQGASLPGAQVMLLSAAEPHSGAGSGLFSALQLASGAAIAQAVGVILTDGTVGITALMLATTVVALWAASNLSRMSPEVAEDAVA